MIANEIAKVIVQFMLRLPPDVHGKLSAWANKEDRSLHAQILYILKRAIEADEKDNPS